METRSRTRSARRGFTLVELLATVLILAVLAAVAVPLYLNQRRASAARGCLANISEIAHAESGYALRNGEYTEVMANLVGSQEGIGAIPYCPLDGAAAYSLVVDSSGNLTISCPNGSKHQQIIPTASWSLILVAPASEAASGSN